MIDYTKIARAVDYYKTCGFVYIDVPWIISERTLRITKPPHARCFSTLFGCLVASGEQSFLEIRNELDGKYQCVTPCFRDEKEVDDLHRNYFMKVELIETNPADIDRAYWDMLVYAKGFFEHYDFVDIVDTDEGKDIFINGIEVGSYGIRAYKDFRWVFGTGVAEPRLSQALIGV